jgi:GntR family transcriptional regulator/MocR family aminotransferase
MVWIGLDRSSGAPLIRQIYDELRTRILNKELRSGEKLPSTRRLAEDLKVSRNVVLEAYEQLLAEGYLESAGGSGTYVAKGAAFETNAGQYVYETEYEDDQDEQNAGGGTEIDFESGVPDLSLFPKIPWAKCLKEACLDAPVDTLNYSSAAGIYDLRVSLCRLLLRTKGIRCVPEQVIVLSGSIEGFLIIAKLLGDTCQTAIIEDPSYNGIKFPLEAMNIDVCPVPADEKGMRVDRLPKAKKAGFIIVTPSHHFPLGGVLPIQRRIKLLEYAGKRGMYIVENDYDSEFRYTGQPISALHLLDPRRVVHVGTFSESMYPGIRIGYMIVPEKIAGKCGEIKASLGLVKSSVEQIALSSFIKRGYFERHLNRMKKHYQRKREVLINELKRAFDGGVCITGDSTGLYVVAEFEKKTFTPKTIHGIESRGIMVYPVGDHCINKRGHSKKLIMGFGNLTVDAIRDGVARLKEALNRNSA